MRRVRDIYISDNSHEPGGEVRLIFITDEGHRYIAEDHLMGFHVHEDKEEAIDWEEKLKSMELKSVEKEGDKIIKTYGKKES